jgi:hypothetical protein
MATNKNDDARKVAFLAAPNAASAARIIDKPGKGFRDALRRAGFYESRGTGWSVMTPEQREAFYPVAPVAE